MAAKFTAEQVEALLASAFRTVMRASRETVSVERVYDPEVDLEAQGEYHTAMEEDGEEAESQVPTTEDLTTIQGLGTVVAKALKKTLKEVRETAPVEINSSAKKSDDRALRAVTNLITAAAYNKLKSVVLTTHFLKKELGTGGENYNKFKNHFQRELKRRKIELHRVNQTKGHRRKAHGSEVMVYTVDDLPMMRDVLREVAVNMYNV